MKKETMQAVSYHCDVCGVKLPVVPPGVSAKVVEQREFAHYVLIVNSAVIHTTYLQLGDGPSHVRQRIQEPKQLDLCQGCAALPLTTIIVKAVEKLEKHSAE
jgi:hypothetical protein